MIFNLRNNILRICNNTYHMSYMSNNATKIFSVQAKLYSSSKIRNEISLANPALLKYLEYIKKEYWDLHGAEQLNNASRKRLNYLLPIVRVMEEQECVHDNLKNLEEMSAEEAKDPQMIELVKEEREVYNNILSKLNDKLLLSLLPNSPDDDCQSMVLEVTAGVGGQEAMLFARELWDMYIGYILHKRWDYQIAQLDSTDIGGIRHGSLLISGQDSYKTLKYEGGVHRVQRIPSTEKSGRVHTSTVTVATLPQPDEVDVPLNNKDLKIETKKASGAGGQHVNTTDSAVRIVHLPTGIAVECQAERSQIKNKEMAISRLKAKLYEKQMDEQNAKTEGLRKAQVGSSMRNEKIRTYNYNQDRITDHRLAGAGGSANYHNLKVFMEGGDALDQLIKRLDEISREELLLASVNSCK